MADKIKLVQGDNLPDIELALHYADGIPLDVSEATVVVYFRAQGATEVLATLPCSYKTDGVDGLVTFSFPGAALDVPPGPYEGEVEADFAGSKQTVYELLKFTVRAQFQ